MKDITAKLRNVFDQVYLNTMHGYARNRKGPRKRSKLKFKIKIRYQKNKKRRKRTNKKKKIMKTRK